jgi:hypothetical protein
MQLTVLVLALAVACASAFPSLMGDVGVEHGAQYVTTPPGRPLRCEISNTSLTTTASVTLTTVVVQGHDTNGDPATVLTDAAGRLSVLLSGLDGTATARTVATDTLGRLVTVRPAGAVYDVWTITSVDEDDVTSEFATAGYNSCLVYVYSVMAVDFHLEGCHTAGCGLSTALPHVYSVAAVTPSTFEFVPYFPAYRIAKDNVGTATITAVVACI